ncbi:MAG: hypothetical protein AB7P12_01795 [Alphaproteobacteria bacterium]
MRYPRVVVPTVFITTFGAPPAALELEPWFESRFVATGFIRAGNAGVMTTAGKGVLLVRSLEMTVFHRSPVIAFIAGDPQEVAARRGIIVGASR